MPNTPNEPSKSSKPASADGPPQRSGPTDRPASDSNRLHGSNRKNRIPELSQPTFTPEQLALKAKDRARRQRMSLVQNVLIKGGGAIAAIALVSGLIYFFFLRDEANRGEIAVIETGKTAATSFEKVLNSGTSLELMQYESDLQKNLFSQPLPVIIERLKEKNLIGQRLESLDEDESTKLVGLEFQLDSLILLDQLSVANSLKDYSARQSLFEVANRLSDHTDPKIARKAQLGLSVASVNDYVHASSDENYEEMETLVSQVATRMIDDITVAKKLQVLVELVNACDRADHAKRFSLAIGNILKKSSLEEVENVGVDIHDKMITGEMDYPELDRRILANESQAIQKLGDTVELVQNNSLVSDKPISKLISLVENLSQIGQPELGKEYMTKLKQSIANMENPTRREWAEQAVADYEKRISLTNKVFNFSGSDYENVPVDLKVLKGKVVVLLFFSARNHESSVYLARIRDLQYLNSRGVEWVIFSMDDNPNETILRAVQKSIPGSQCLTAQSAPGYLEQCPVSKVPYAVIIDREHLVVSTNVEMDGLRTQVEAQIGG